MSNSLLEEIDAALAPEEALSVLRERIGLSNADLSVAASTVQRTVRNWSTENGVSHASDSNKERLDDLRAIVVILAETTTSTDAIRAWLKARNRALDHERPLEVLGKGEFARVREAALAYLHGMPG